MIIKQTSCARLSWPLRFGILLVAALALPLSAQTADDANDASVAAQDNLDDAEAEEREQNVLIEDDLFEPLDQKENETHNAPVAALDGSLDAEVKKTEKERKILIAPVDSDDFRAGPVRRFFTFNAQYLS